MEKFRVYASYRVNLLLDIEAENEDEAWKIAKAADGADFEPFDDSDWEINDVVDWKLLKFHGLIEK